MADLPEHKSGVPQPKYLCLGLLAHVDAGKTTLSEAMLYTGGAIRRLGRVDHRDAFLDTYSLERERGITIFSKQALLSFDQAEFMLMDTPGHVDFSAEMERTLQVLDYAILVISGTDGVQGHTATLWNLLEQYQIPTFLFINKMDLPGRSREQLLEELRQNLSSACIDFGNESGEAYEAWQEELAVCDEAVLEHYLECGAVPTESIIELIAARKVFPCFFGSALKLDGVQALLQGLQQYTGIPLYPEEFGARVYKIARDPQGNRLTYMKITGGSLKVRTPLGEKQEKISQLRIYSGEKFTTTDEVPAGRVCAVTGLSQTMPGEGLGSERSLTAPVLEPVLNYRLELPEGQDVHTMLGKLRQLEEEDPQLHILWNETLQEIQLQLMGEVQLEILRTLIQERFDVPVEFGTGTIVYKETITEPVEGVGHYEPLRHYAEAHLLLEPLPAGSGLIFRSKCSEDDLDRNWQRLILTHLEEKEHIGVLAGAPITDMRITLIAGRAHQKHTEGGDFRQATYRAVRQGLMQASSVLLEPWYSFRLEIPTEQVGRAMTDIQKMSGSFDEPQTGAELTIITGRAPVAAMQHYHREVTVYTRGRGRLFCQVKGYEKCHNEAEVLASIAYDSEHDLENTADSVFCSHGAGFVVKWDQVYEHMHLERAWQPQKELPPDRPALKKQTAGTYAGTWEEDRELEEIFTRTFGPIRRRLAVPSGKQTIRSPRPQQELPERYRRKQAVSENYLLVDGYNIIFAWPDLHELARANLDAARYKLLDVLSDYQGYNGRHLICVFDAYKVKGNPGSTEKYHNIDVVYTKEAETADMYIEKVTLEISKNHTVTVATSDRLEQLIITGHGAVRISAERLREEIDGVRARMRAEFGIEIAKKG
ncbi:MAG: GTP-binding protein [Lachnospiraceae bacterium]|nr:GTP-binding protein [Lachnospiraceae bacterium]